MLIPQGQHKSSDGHGCTPDDLAEVRRQLADPSRMQDRARQRLKVLARRLADLQTLGDEYARVQLSDRAAEALSPAPVG